MQRTEWEQLWLPGFEPRPCKACWGTGTYEMYPPWSGWPVAEPCDACEDTGHDLG